MVREWVRPLEVASRTRLEEWAPEDLQIRKGSEARPHMGCR